ncbi:helix-turn-helix domain-containing protein [Actinomadura latina]|uniref:Helix-turn-helix domain-containing protein n=1 Tax=Actinomadura latina TaxID=163603 RepID=A0A846Z672_9ACTN|nr:helix-turn-helix transcriptional regulator [Actinomadura latina]NKZ06135.1 helix-turn-helix domain-containing protein [Actinomadura latina]
MIDDEAELDPSAATTEEQFVVALRRLRERSGLTYKEIERRTSAADGLPLPASTLATALHRRTVPRREIVATLVEVCGGDATRWLAARERLLHPMPPEPSAPPAPDEPAESPTPQEDPAPPRPPRSRTTAVLAAALAVAAIAAGIVLTRPSQNSDGHSQAAPSNPPPAVSGAKLELGGLCLSERPHDKTGLIYLAHCAQSFPARQLTQDGKFWRVTTQHPEFGPGCMGIVDASFKPGAPLSDDTCDRIQPDRFTLRTLAGGVQLRPQDRDLCVGVKGTPAARAPVLQLPCDDRAPGQLFTIHN